MSVMVWFSVVIGLWRNCVCGDSCGKVGVVLKALASGESGAECSWKLKGDRRGVWTASNAASVAFV